MGVVVGFEPTKELSTPYSVINQDHYQFWTHYHLVRVAGLQPASLSAFNFKLKMFSNFIILALSLYL